VKKISKDNTMMMSGMIKGSIRRCPHEFFEFLAPIYTATAPKRPQNNTYEA